jgi:hypothetical protein
VIEYVLMLAAVVGFYFLIAQGLKRANLPGKLMGPLREDFAFAYKYGHPKARGFDEGDPVYHPRVPASGNFRIFINPRQR